MHEAVGISTPAARGCLAVGRMSQADTSSVSTQTAVWIATAAGAVVAGVVFWLGMHGDWLSEPKKFGIWLVVLSFMAGVAFGWPRGALVPYLGFAAFGVTGILLDDNREEIGIYFAFFVVPLYFAVPAFLGAAVRWLLTR